MKKLLVCAFFSILFSARLDAAIERVPATARPACTAGGPMMLFLTQQSSSTDCDATGGGSTEALCCCLNASWAACVSAGGSGTVTSVGVAVPTEWTVSGSPVTTSGTITIAEATQSANTVYAGPTSGGAAAPGFRALGLTDLPSGTFISGVTVPGIGVASGVWGVSNGITFEGATADGSETTVSVVDPTADHAISFPDADGTVALSSCSTCSVERAGGVWFGNGTLVIEGANVDEFETILFSVEPTADAFFAIPNATGYAMISDCSTCVGAAANSVMGTTNGILFEGTTANGFETTLLAGDPTADRSVTLPNSTGTLVTSLLQKGVLLGSAIGVNMNTTGDNSITLASTDYIIDEIIVTNASISLTTAAGGVYTGAGKTGTTFVASSQVYSALTTASNVLKLTMLAAASNAHRSAATIYLSLTTAQGAAATADVYVFGTRWN